MTLSALLLAGGESRRMGRDKATIEFEGEPFWKRQLELLRGLDREKVFVSARAEPSWLPGDVELLLDDPPSRGPLSGVSKALTAIETTHLVVLAVDMPFMTAGELRRLVMLAAEGKGVIPVVAKRAEPLAAIYPADAIAHFENALAGPDFSLQSVVRQLAATEKVILSTVPESRTNLYRSINEPTDMEL